MEDRRWHGCHPASSILDPLLTRRYRSATMLVLWWAMALLAIFMIGVPKSWQDHFTGAFAAASSTLAHAAGPIISLYLLPMGIGRDLFIGTGAIYFFIVNTAKLPVYWAGGQFKHASPLFAASFLPVVV